MNLKELKKQLDVSSLPENAYSLAGGLPNEAFCMEESPDGKWRTYYSERGGRTGLMTFDTEDEACDYFFTEYVTEFMPGE